jgi:hypothetical protein
MRAVMAGSSGSHCRRIVVTEARVMWAEMFTAAATRESASRTGAATERRPSASRLRPDTPSDRRLYDQMVAGDVDAWRGNSLQQIEDAGQQELLNWFPLLGAMGALGRSRPSWSEFVETDVFNSNKVFATYLP